MIIKTKLLGNMVITLIVNDDYDYINLEFKAKNFLKRTKMQIDNEQPNNVAVETATWLDKCLEKVY